MNVTGLLVRIKLLKFEFNKKQLNILRRWGVLKFYIQLNCNSF